LSDCIEITDTVDVIAGLNIGKRGTVASFIGRDPVIQFDGKLLVVKIANVRKVDLEDETDYLEQSK
jgi:ribosomal protein L24